MYFKFALINSKYIDFVKMYITCGTRRGRAPKAHRINSRVDLVLSVLQMLFL